MADELESMPESMPSLDDGESDADCPFTDDELASDNEADDEPLEYDGDADFGDDSALEPADLMASILAAPELAAPEHTLERLRSSTSARIRSHRLQTRWSRSRNKPRDGGSGVRLQTLSTKTLACISSFQTLFSLVLALLHIVHY